MRTVYSANEKQKTSVTAWPMNKLEVSQ